MGEGGVLVMQGTVKFFHDVKNYGFITPDEGDEDVFFHVSVVESSSIAEGDEVEFESEDAEKGPKATKVEMA
jgi:CspA family cold shock protein